MTQISKSEVTDAKSLEANPITEEAKEEELNLPTGGSGSLIRK